MKIDKAIQRDRKIDKRRHGMVVDGKGVFLLEEQKWKRAEKIRRDRKEKEKLKDC